MNSSNGLDTTTLDEEDEPGPEGEIEPSIADETSPLENENGENADSVPICEPDETITYEVMKGGSVRGGDKLFDSHGYSYTLHKSNPSGSKLWRCCVRKKSKFCHATIKESSDGVFEKGLRDHNHAGEPDSYAEAIIQKSTKQQAIDFPTKRAPDVANDAIQELMLQGISYNPARPMEHLCRNINHYRQARNINYRKIVTPGNSTNHRTTNISNKNLLDFELLRNELPDEFLQKDLKITGARHIIFATTQQLGVLALSKTWYTGVTSRVVGAPFCHLFTFHSFTSKEFNVSHLPLVFCFMSRKLAEDYEIILTEILELIKSPKVQRIVVDFDKAKWKGFKKARPSVSIKGCPYFFTQAIFHKVREFELEQKYTTDKTASSVIKKFAALCYIPKGSIKPAFKELKNSAVESGIKDLFSYMKNTWIRGVTWRPSRWSVYDLAIRTKDDVESWHDSLYEKCCDGMGLYMLVKLLYEETVYFDEEVEIVSDSELIQKRKRRSMEVDAQIYDLWKKLKRSKILPIDMLKSIAELNGPYLSS